MRNKYAMPTDTSLILTYRCQMHCKMCNIWKNPSEREREIPAMEFEKLPDIFKFINVTGGEPLLREDLGEIISILFEKSKRIVISTSGYHYEKILELAERFPRIGVRVSIEGLCRKNDELRGREGGFDRGLKTLLGLKRMGIKDIGFGITVSNHNSGDMLWLYELSKAMGMEFATAAFHNSFYFHKYDNVITNLDEVEKNFRELAERQMRENNPKAWFRALFNLGLIGFIHDKKRMLPCEAGRVNFFIDPYGEVYPCNGLEGKYWKMSMGNISKVESFNDLWFSRRAEEVRQKVRTCPKNCWMIGTASPVMHKYIMKILPWIIKNKIRSLCKVPIDNRIPYFDVGQDPRQGDRRIEGKEQQ